MKVSLSLIALTIAVLATATVQAHAELKGNGAARVTAGTSNTHSRTVYAPSGRPVTSVRARAMAVGGRRVRPAETPFSVLHRTNENRPPRWAAFFVQGVICEGLRSSGCHSSGTRS
jgi:hypothetical protein